MANYNVNIYALNDATTNVAGIIGQYKGGNQWDWHAASKPTLKLNSGATSDSVAISDVDGSSGTLDDDSTGQTLTTNTTIGGTTYAAGSIIENEYEINLTDGSGNSFRLVAISINDTIIGFTFEGPVPPPNVTLSYAAGNFYDIQSMQYPVMCFCSGTVIETASGECQVEHLAIGDRIKTADNGYQPLRWITLRALSPRQMDQSPHLRPIRIKPGALGNGTPHSTLAVSPQHRILVRSRIAGRLSGSAEVLVAAKHLCSIPGIAADHTDTPVRYFHLLLDHHQIVFANGAATESFYCGDQAMRGVPLWTRTEIRTRLPQIAEGLSMAPARPFLNGKLGRQLAERHARNHQPLIGQLQQPALTTDG